jgi:hypothetical protein
LHANSCFQPLNLTCNPLVSSLLLFKFNAHRYTPASRMWKSLAPLNTPRKLHAVAGLPDGRLFTFGGRVSDEARVGPIKAAER